MTFTLKNLEFLELFLILVGGGRNDSAFVQRRADKQSYNGMRGQRHRATRM